MADLRFSYTRQSEALGLGHAVLCAADLVGDEPFAVLLGDVIMEGPIPATRQLTEIYEATGKGAIHVEEVPREKVHMYGIIDAKPTKEGRWKERLLKISDLVEKPSADKAPSNWGVSGRYVLPPEIFDHLAKTKPGAGGEIQLTDGLRALAKDPGPVGLPLRRQDARCRRQAWVLAGDRRTCLEKSETRERTFGPI